MEEVAMGAISIPTHNGSVMEPIERFRLFMGRVPDRLGDLLERIFVTLVDELHHHIDRQLSNFLAGRGARRIEWESGRDMSDLYARLTGLERVHRRRGRNFVSRLIDDMMVRVEQIINYYREGVCQWAEAA